MSDRNRVATDQNGQIFDGMLERMGLADAKVPNLESSLELLPELGAALPKTSPSLIKLAGWI